MTGAPGGRAPAPETLRCKRCLRVREARELDGVLWCDTCKTEAYHRATFQGWAFGGGLALFLGLYIWFGVRPDLSLIPAAWAATLLVAFYLGARAAREILFGIERFRGRPRPEAVAPNGSDGVEPREGG